MKQPIFTKSEWAILVIAVIALLSVLLITGCAVPVRNENNDKPLLTAATGVSKADGAGGLVHNPSLRQPKSEDYQHEEPIDWRFWLELGLGVLGIGGVGGIGHAISTRGRLRRAEAAEDEGWDHALSLAKQVPPERDA